LNKNKKGKVKPILDEEKIEENLIKLRNQQNMKYREIFKEKEMLIFKNMGETKKTNPTYVKKMFQKKDDVDIIDDEFFKKQETNPISSSQALWINFVKNDKRSNKGNWNMITNEVKRLEEYKNNNPIISVSNTKTQVAFRVVDNPIKGIWYNVKKSKVFESNVKSPIQETKDKQTINQVKESPPPELIVEECQQFENKTKENIVKRRSDEIMFRIKDRIEMEKKIGRGFH